MKIVGFVRVSTDEQAKDTRASIPAQVDEIDAIVARLGADLIGPFVLDNVGGSDVPNTPEWVEVSRLIEDPDTHLATVAVDRLIRPDTWDYRVFQRIHETATRVFLPGGREADLTNEDSAFSTGIDALVAAREKASIRKRTRRAKERKRKDGEHPQGKQSLPTGLTFDRKSRTWGYTPEASVVREAFVLYAEGGLSLGAVGRKLGVGRTTVKQWLTNPVYRGVRVYDLKAGPERYRSKKQGRQSKRKPVPRRPDEIIRVRIFEADKQLVSDELWHAANRRLNAVRARVSKRRTETAPEIWASGVLYSDLDPAFRPPSSGFAILNLAPPRHVLYGVNSGDRPVEYVCRCSLGTGDPNAPKPSCGLRHLPAEHVNKALDKLFADYAAAGWYRAAVVRRLNGGSEEEHKAERDRLDAVLANLDRKAERLSYSFVEGRIKQAAYDKLFAEIEADKAQTQADLEAHERRKVPGSETVGARLAEMTWDAAWAPQRKREWLARYVAQITVSNRGIESVLIRLPGERGLTLPPVDAGVGGITVERGNAGPTYNPPGSVTWVDLLGYDPLDFRSRNAAEGRYWAREVIAELGLGKHSRLTYLLGKGVLPEPSERIGNKKVWTTADLEASRAALVAYQRSRR